jgi:hypothetical protein
MTKTSKVIFFALFALFLAPIAVNAMTFRSSDAVSVGKNEVIDGSLFAAGANLSIDGKINGDLICAGQSININGEVAGDVICAGQSININGKVGGSVRAAGNSLNVNGEVAKNLMFAGASLNTTASSSVRWEMLIGTAAANLKGSVGRDLVGAGANVNLGGSIGRDVTLKLDSKNSTQAGLNLEDSASVGGKLTYTDTKDANISKKAVVRGEVKRLEPKLSATGGKRGRSAGAWFMGVIYKILSALVIGLVLLLLWGEEVKKILANLATKMQSAFGWGLVVLLITPPLCLLLLITLIGAPLAVIIGVLWLIAICLSKILVAIFVGQKLLERFWQERKESLYTALVIGVIVSYLVFSIPVIGWLVALLAIIWGLGSIYLYFKKA